MEKVIISGANGFLGKALIKSLIKDNIFIYALVKDLSKVQNELIKSKYIKYIDIDINFIDDLHNIIRDNDIDAYFHFAWEGSSGKLRGDYKTQIGNIYSTCEAVLAAKKIGCKKFIFAESIMEHEISKAIESSENISINTLYSTAKLSSKYMSKVLCENYGIKYIGLLISNIFGPGEKSERLINTTIRNLNEKIHCSFSSCEQLYDFIYIDDAIEMIKLIYKDGMPNESYYIGNKNQKKLKEFILDLYDVVFDGNSDFKHLLGFGELSNPKTILEYSEFDVKKVYDKFGFECKVPFKEGIARTLNSINKESFDV